LKSFIDEFDQKMYIVTLEELEVRFIEVFQRLAREICQTNNLGIKSVINHIKQYIDQNYTDNITLNTLAEKFYVNSSYVSRLFKEELGENFIDYLTGKRMEEAMRLLLSTEMHVYEISEKIGYGNPKYFSQLFKKYTGMSPREYRDQK
jgi:two-component system response regulator YesN